MQEQNWDIFNKLWSKTIMQCTQKNADDFANRLAFEDLIEYELAEIAEALKRHRRNPETGHFAPTVASVIRILHGTHAGAVNKAWAKLVESVKAFNPDSDIVWRDLVMMQALSDMGGWHLLASCETKKELSFYEHQFKGIYRSYLETGLPGKVVNIFKGRTNLQREKYGLPTVPVVPIEDQMEQKRDVKTQGRLSDQMLKIDGTVTPEQAKGNLAKFLNKSK